MTKFLEKKVVRTITIILATLVVFALGFLYYKYRTSPLLEPVSSLEVKEYIRILDKYTFQRLRDKKRVPTQINTEKVLKKDPAFTSYLFSFLSDGKKVTGQLNIPTAASAKNKAAVIVMIRGYVDKENYYTGLGTRRASEEFARAGYLTIAPDFLGYGGSDQESFDLFEVRFEKPATVLNLLASLETVPKADTKRIGIWGHSNGGQIALSVLEISQKPIPTVLWAPVTQAFPDSILQYVDELPDKGEYIKTQLNLFYERYKNEDYSIASHWDDIIAPLQIHQGLSDELVPESFTRKVVELLTSKKKNVLYLVHPNENHNFTLGSFDSVVLLDLSFFSSHLK